MKKITLLTLLSILLVSCGLSNEEQMLYDYQKQGMLETLNIDIEDLNFNIISVKKVKEIKSSDSLVVLQKYFDENKNKKIEQMLEQIDFYNETLAKTKEDLKSTKFESMKELYNENIERYEKEIESFKGVIDLYNGDCKGTFLEPVLFQINEYKKEPNKILSNKYKGEYSFENPLLNNIKQTFTKYYYTNSDSTRFIKSEDVE